MTGTPNTKIFERLQIELRILSDIARRVEYAFIDDLIQSGQQENRADVQLLDLLIQSTEALDKIMGQVAMESQNGCDIDADRIVHGVTLQDMANRLRGGTQKVGNSVAPCATSSIDLF